LLFSPGETILEGGRFTSLAAKEGAMDAAERARLVEETGELARAYDMKFAG
jgi:hypothetical protein